MEGSDEFGWDQSASSRGLNAFVASSASLENRLAVSRDASDNTGWVVAAKGNDLVISCTENCDNQIGSSGVCGNELDPEICGVVAEDISLREWLDKPERSVDLFECLHVFRQIVETVNLAHSQGMVVHNVRPSCFIMSSFNRISFIESASSSSSDSDSFMDRKMSKVSKDQVRQSSEFETEESAREISSSARSTSANWIRLSSMEKAGERREKKSREMEVAEGNKNFPLKQILMVETNWYTSPEEAAGAPSSFSSDIYRLGVLLFEVFCTFSSLEEKLRTMSNLRHRVLPPQLLLKWPKEASFCLWLLHPQPSTRPKMSEVLQSEFLNEARDDLDELEDAINLKEEIEEHELLLEFLLQLQEKRQETAKKLHDLICYLSADIEEVLKQQSVLTKQGSFYAELDKDEGSEIGKVDQISGYPPELEELSTLSSRKRFRQGFQIQKEDKLTGNLTESQNSESRSENQEKLLAKTTRLMKNFKKLESAYFSTGCRLVNPIRRLPNRSSSFNSMGRGSTARTDGSSVDNWASTVPVPHSEEKRRWINPFLEGLCKYLSFSKLKVRADLKQGDLLNSSNLVCSLSFDRDKEFFATAGVNRKIKVFECDTILNNDRDIHYPVIEMASRSKFSSICWNSYIKSQIASSDFEGVVQVWDVTRGQVFVEMREHERRVWSVDFSLADPTKLASGSDDGTVKLWNINQAILFLHLVAISFETKRGEHRYYQDQGQYMLCPVFSGFFTFTCSWLC
ncbi:protein SPA1-RELATED 3-like isoform X2 [Aristolochia californica]|uniref:protein SPA1-RELATED 3-like isoform X2 n=1 Tax=Aristolochia californica TaxID=171875 RepID=UPI0035DD82A8